MSLAKDILDEARAVLAALPTSRLPGRNFTQHPRNQPFTQKPGGSSTDNFHVDSGGQQTSAWFGRTGTKQDQLVMLVHLGHGPWSGRETSREDFVAQDVERIRDIFEMRTWTASVEACFFEGVEPNRADYDWWVTTLTFRVHFTGSIQTS